LNHRVHRLRAVVSGIGHVAAHGSDFEIAAVGRAGDGPGDGDPDPNDIAYGGSDELEVLGARGAIKREKRSRKGAENLGSGLITSSRL
jgi:hypothetical protein